MKRIPLVAIFVLMASVVCAKEIAPQKFQVRYTITYNSLTLEEAAEREMLIKKYNKDACRIRIDVENESNVLTIP